VANKIGQLVIELAANTARLQGDMGKAVGIAERGAAQIKKAFSFVTAGAGGGLIGTALIGAARNAISFGDELNKAAIKAGIGGKAISELAYAAKLADVDIASLSTAIKKMQVSISEAASGGKDQIAALKALGLTVDQLLSKRPDKQFELLADQISRLKDPADRARAATEIFGKAGADLLPLFSQGAEGIRKAREEAEKLGFSFGDESLKSLGEADDAVKRLNASWEAFSTTLIAKAAPAITRVLNAASSGSFSNVGAGFLKGGFVGMFRAGLDERQKQDDAAWNEAHSGTIVRHEATTPIGFAAANAAAESKKAAEASAKEMQKFVDSYHDAVRDMNADVDREADASLRQRMDDWGDAQDAADEYYRRLKESEKELTVYREKQWAESMQVYRDYFVNAIEDMINTGKFKWRDFLTFIVAEITKRKIGQLFDAIFAKYGSGGGSGGGGSGIFGSILSAIISNVGGGGGSAGAIDGKASGGAVSAGRTYLVGEQGPELFRSGSSGWITPNHAMAGGPNVTVVNHIDARGATVDAVKLLPSFGKQISDMTEQRVVERLRRNYYGFDT